MKTTLEKKIEQSEKLILSFFDAANKNGETPILAYSGGKDSDICLNLIQNLNLKCKIIYNSTTVDRPNTIAHALSVGAEIIRPQKTFAQLIAERGTPNRHRRWCCSFLKEKYVGEYVVQGIRAAESVNRKKKYKEPQICREYGKKEKSKILMPLLNWSDKDVENFILKHKVNVHPFYFSEGFFDVKKRVGCIACPLASPQKRLEDFKAYPVFAKNIYLKNIRKFFDTHPNSASLRLNENDEYAKFLYDLFGKKYNKNTLFGEIPAKQIVSKILNIDL